MSRFATCLLVVIVSACANQQSSASSPYQEGNVAVTVGQGQDAGVQTPPIPSHRLKMRYMRSSDGLMIPTLVIIDTAWNMQCTAMTDDNGVTRCFPLIWYTKRTWANNTCSEPLVVGYTDGFTDPSVVGSSLLDKYRINRVGAKVSATSYYFTDANGNCQLQDHLDVGQALYHPGEDITSTLETLEVVNQ